MTLEEHIHKILEATHFATVAHAGQVRKTSGLPYVTHVIDVAQITGNMLDIRHVGAEIYTDAIVAAILHDTVEDTDVTLQSVNVKFGSRVAHYVDALTKESTAAETNAKLGKCAIVDVIKIADIMSNIQTIRETANPARWATKKIGTACCDRFHTKRNRNDHRSCVLCSVRFARRRSSFDR